MLDAYSTVLPVAKCTAGTQESKRANSRLTSKTTLPTKVQDGNRDAVAVRFQCRTQGNQLSPKSNSEFRIQN